MNFFKSHSGKKAIVYNRHSAEDKQENSVPIQRGHHQKFAAQHNILIVHDESDEGVSGLTANRPGFQRLLNNWINNPDAPEFDYILVYDVSRWGRFQNHNEAAHYEFLCELRGKKVLYTSKPFPQAGQELTESIVTPMERWMAAQYSRQLSEKVWYGCMKISQDGYLAGGTPCYGMGRLLLDVNKKPVRILKDGEHKQISNERVTLTPLNDHTTQTVKDIYDMFVRQWKTPEDIAEILNERGILSAMGKEWNRQKIVRILTNETYTGALIYNKSWGRLKQKKARNPRNEWVVTPNAFPAIVDPVTFWKAQENLFWLLPSRWKRGLMAIAKVRKTIEKEILNLLIAGGFSEDEARLELRKFPLVYSVKFKEETFSYRCFKITEKTRDYENVFAVSIDLAKKDLLDTLFLIPTADFNESNFILFSEADPCYQQYNVGLEKAYQVITPFIEKMEKKNIKILE